MHTLQKLIIEANYYDEKGVDQFYHRAMQLWYQDLQPEMEMILNRHSPDNEIVKINNLTIDLGITHELELRHQWVSRFKNEFEKQLQNKIHQIRNGSGSMGEPVKEIEKEIFMESEGTDTIYIDNAGLVLISPFIPTLFEKAGYTTTRVFRDQSDQYRAVHLLQYTVNHGLNNPEYHLSLSKILCGIDVNELVNMDVVLTNSEKELADGLLSSVIMQWKSLGNTTTEGFQQSFLERNGAIRIEEDRWRLIVESKAFDVLLDQIPWSYSSINYPWMEKPLFTEWR